MRSNFLGLLLIVLVFVAMTTLGGSLSLFLSMPGLLAVIGIVGGALVFKFGFLGLSHCKSSTAYRNQFCSYGSAVSMNAGVLATVVAMIQLFAQVDWSDSGQLGEGISIGLTTVLYGALLSLCFKLYMVPLAAGSDETKV